MKCTICGSDNVARSHRRGIEKVFRYIHPRTPYRCKECWGRFWIFENPFKNTGAKIVGGGLVCLLLLFFAWSLFFANKEKSWQDQIKNEVRPVVRESSPPAAKPSDILAKADTENKSESASGSLADDTEKTETVPPVEDREPQTPSAEKAEADAVTSPPASESEKASLPAEPPSSGKSSETAAGETGGMPGTPSEETAAVKTENAGKAGKKPAETPLPVSADQKTAVPEKLSPLTVNTEKTGETPARTESESGKPGDIPQKSRAGKTGKPSAEEKKSESAGEKEDSREIRALKKIETVSGEGTFGIHILADGPVRQHNFFPLKSPPKLVVDLPGKWKHRGDALYKVKNDMVSQVRVGLHPEFIRVVMDLKVSGPLHPVFSETEQGLRVEIRSGAKQ